MRIIWMLLLGAICTIRNALAVRACHTLRLDGVQYWKQYEGLYVRSQELECTHRRVYTQQTNSSQKHYLYYLNPAVYNYGWVFGSSPCARSGHIYSPHVSNRPDYILGYWKELNRNGEWDINQELRVRCTEGLGYRTMIGVTSAVLFGVPLLVFLTVCVVRSIKDRKKPRRRRRRRTAPTGVTRRVHHTRGRQHRSHRHPRGAVRPGQDVYSIQMNNVQLTPLPPYIRDPPPYEPSDWWSGEALPVDVITGETLTPPSYSETPPTDCDVMPQPVYDVIGGTPPPYEETVGDNPQVVNGGTDDTER